MSVSLPVIVYLIALFTGKAKSYQEKNIVGTMHVCKAFFIRLKNRKFLRICFIFSVTDCKAISPISPLPLVSQIQSKTPFLEEKRPG